jgi:uncharacterized protein (DUF1800 family)
MAGISSAMLAACGGGGGNNNITPQFSDKPETSAQAARFLMQASMGATPTDLAQVQALGYDAWINEQLNAKALSTTHVSLAKASQTAFKNDKVRTANVLQDWWTMAVIDPAQLRQRVAFALSEIFVVSTVDSVLGDNGLLVSSYMDMLDHSIDGTYRELLEGVALHPAMGIYLSHRGNRKEDPKSGRVPDENFAREVMQLFSIGLHELNEDGSLKLKNNVPVETYTPADVKGLAKVMTGFSWWRPPEKAAVKWYQCFYRNATECTDERQLMMPMSGYAEEHSLSEKAFLGKVIPEQTTADPVGDLKIALDLMGGHPGAVPFDGHPNVPPFISRQLIQRLVTSNPSPAYVADVARTFKATGGSIKAVIKAILLHPEARVAPAPGTTTFGKVREPVLRATHLLRALPHTSDMALAAATAGTLPIYAINETDNPGIALGQSPLRSPSVFNFFRPGYVPAQTELGRQGLVAPELQIASETSVIGYANAVIDVLNNGFGVYDATRKRRDVQFDLSSFDALADDPAQLMDTLSLRLLGQATPEPLRTTAVDALTKMVNKTATDKRSRVQAAVLMIAVSPQFTVQQ